MAQGMNNVILLSIFLFSVLGGVLSNGVEISIYSLSIDQFTDMKDQFAGYISIEAMHYCKVNCTEEFKSVNLTVQLSEIEKSKPGVNTTVLILNKDDMELPAARTKEMLTLRYRNINEASGQSVTAVDDEHFSKEADDPANWIIVSIFIVLTIILLLVVVYLSKHKVNHVDEHYEMMESKDKSASGEVAA